MLEKACDDFPLKLLFGPVGLFSVCNTHHTALIFQNLSLFMTFPNPPLLFISPFTSHSLVAHLKSQGDLQISTQNVKVYKR